MEGKNARVFFSVLFQSLLKKPTASAFYLMWQSDHEKHWISIFFSRSKTFAQFDWNQTATNQWIFFLLSLVAFVEPLYDETFSPAIYISNGFAYRKRDHWSIKRTLRNKKTSALWLHFAIMSSIFFFQFHVVCCHSLRFNYFSFKHSHYNGHGDRQPLGLVVGTQHVDNQHFWNITQF